MAVVRLIVLDKKESSRPRDLRRGWNRRSLDGDVVIAMLTDRAVIDDVLYSVQNVSMHFRRLMFEAEVFFV